MKRIFNSLKRNKISGSPVFAVGTGRCGTHLLSSLLEVNKDIDSNHIQNLDADSFYRFCAWNKIDVDVAGLIEYRKNLISTSIQKKKLYFESNPYLAFHIEVLHRYLNSKFIFIYRNPEDVIRSHIVKGWYADTPSVYKKEKIVGFQYGMKTNHFLGRIIPGGEEFERWSELTRAGKIAWMWNVVNCRIFQQLEELEGKAFHVKIEELTYDRYSDMVEFMETGKISEKKFHSIMNSRPGKGRKKHVDPFTDRELKEIEKETAEGRKLLGYN